MTKASVELSKEEWKIGIFSKGALDVNDLKQFLYCFSGTKLNISPTFDQSWLNEVTRY